MEYHVLEVHYAYTNKLPELLYNKVGTLFYRCTQKWADYIEVIRIRQVAGCVIKLMSFTKMATELLCIIFCLCHIIQVNRGNVNFIKQKVGLLRFWFRSRMQSRGTTTFWQLQGWKRNYASSSSHHPQIQAWLWWNVWEYHRVGSGSTTRR